LDQNHKLVIRIVLPGGGQRNVEWVVPTVVGFEKLAIQIDRSVIVDSLEVKGFLRGFRIVSHVRPKPCEAEPTAKYVAGPIDRAPTVGPEQLRCGSGVDRRDGSLFPLKCQAAKRALVSERIASKPPSVVDSYSEPGLARHREGRRNKQQHSNRAKDCH
jgi:hypothetical protein